jgi:hypothetical protein
MRLVETQSITTPQARDRALDSKQIINQFLAAGLCQKRHDRVQSQSSSWELGKPLKTSDDRSRKILAGAQRLGKAHLRQRRPRPMFDINWIAARNGYSRNRLLA